ncbi:MAG: glycosylase [Prevotellaceae bacterium]|nr:glycosylase [Prevotellaceae bacterium]
MPKHLLMLFSAFTLCASGAPKPEQVPETVMKAIYEEVKTPYKYGLVMASEDASKKLDCPTVFYCDSAWYMTYIVFDGKGYETWLAQSSNLLDWKTLGRILSFTPDGWDANQKAGYPALQDCTWGGSYALQKFDGKYWMSYFGGNTEGYEAGLLSIGVACTDDSVAAPREWQRLPAPVLASTDADVRWWENRKQYKSTVIWDKEKITGYPFVMYYNANGDTTQNKNLRWFERIGMAVSDDMRQWKRFEAEPVLAHSRGITGDAVIQKIGDVFVMFYFGAFWEGREEEAFNSFACSYDLVRWTDWRGDMLIAPSEDYDALYAHKSYVLKHNGVVYHFYNAVDKNQRRGIAVATSKDLGKVR